MTINHDIWQLLNDKFVGNKDLNDLKAYFSALPEILFDQEHFDYYSLLRHVCQPCRVIYDTELLTFFTEDALVIDRLHPDNRQKGIIYLLLWACEVGDLDFLDNFITSDYVKNYIQIGDDSLYPHRINLLMNASFWGHLDIVKYLLRLDGENKININSQCVYESTALTGAVGQGRFDIVKYLLTSDELIEHSHLYMKRNGIYSIVSTCALFEKLDIFEYLLDEYHFQIDDDSWTWLNNHPRAEKLLSFIKTKKLYEKLHRDLGIKHTHHQKKI